MPHLLVLQLKRIGDAVLTAPALATLRQALPDWKITLVLAGAAAELGPLFAGVDQVLEWKAGRLNAGLLWQVRRLGADAVLDFTGSDRSALLSRLSGAAVRVAYQRDAVGWWRGGAWNLPVPASVREMTTLEYHHALATAALDKLCPQRPVLPASTSGFLKPDTTALMLKLQTLAGPTVDLSRGYFLIHPGTAREEKFWPPAAWADLLKMLQARYALPILVTGGRWEFEQKQIAEILAKSPPNVVDLSGKLSLIELAGVIARAQLVVSVDTGAMHLASCYGVAQVALFGPTNPYHWAPRHDRARVLRAGLAPGTHWEPRQAGGAMETLPVAEVSAAVDELMRLESR